MERVCFFKLSQYTKAMNYFCNTYNIPIEDDPKNLDSYKTVFFSLLSFRDFFEIAKIAKYKSKSSEWIAGGNATTNPLGIMWIMDYVFIGDAFYSFQNILQGEREMPGMMNCKNPQKTTFNIEPVFEKSHVENEIIISTGCKRRCVFCVNTWKRPYLENDKDNVLDFLKNNKRRKVSLLSNSSDDVSYYDSHIVPKLNELNMFDEMCSNAMASLTPEFVLAKKTELLFGVEGMSERLRKIVNKPISHEKFREVVDLCLSNKKVLRTVFQFNLPSETNKDIIELNNFINEIVDEYNEGLWRIPFIPNHPNPFTPLQWEKPHFNLDMYKSIKELQDKHKARFKDGGLKVYIPNPLSCGSQFTEIITDWMPVTPDVLKNCNRVLKNKHLPFEEYQEMFKDRGMDVDYIFTEKPKDYKFPWDDLVEVKSTKDELWKAKEVMDSRILKL